MNTPARTAFSCRACGSTAKVRDWPQRDRRYGLPGDFYYGECAACGSLGIAAVPPDLARHYPADYHDQDQSVGTGWAGQTEWLFSGGDPASDKLVRRMFPLREARVLDVGCGTGRLLHRLHSRGYRRLRGIDPLLPAAAQRTEPFPLSKGTLADCGRGWDLIMYHHVLEHVADPRAELADAAARLHPEGRVLVRVPLADCRLRAQHGVDWAQWDAPRHLWLPTRRGLRVLAARAGLAVEREFDDANAFGPAGTRLFRHGRQLGEGLVGLVRPRRHVPLTLVSLVAWHLHVALDNFRRAGDQGGVVLRAAATAG